MTYRCANLNIKEAEYCDIEACNILVNLYSNSVHGRTKYSFDNF